MWIRLSGDDLGFKPVGMLMRRWPTETIVVPRPSALIASAGMQSYFEQQSLGYQECARAVGPDAVAASAVSNKMRRLFIALLGPLLIVKYSQCCQCAFTCWAA